MRIHYLQHVPFENPGIILTWAKEKKYTVTCTKMYEPHTFLSLEDFDWLIVMGGPMNIYEEDEYPWLKEEKKFIEKAIEAEKIVIGICLGAQLIADIIGGYVDQNPKKEIGWFPITWTKYAMENQLFSFFPPSPIVFEWHGDTFLNLPSEAVPLAYNKVCKNQAYVYKNHVFGFQFHLENTKEIIKNLLIFCEEDMTKEAYVQSKEEIVEKSDYMRQNQVWMCQFLNELEKTYRKGGVQNTAYTI